MLAVSAYQAAHFLGMPECDVCLAQVTAYMARAPKSNALYTAMTTIRDTIKESGAVPVPLHLRNAPTRLMKDLGYSKGYKYNPAFDTPVDQKYLPDELSGFKCLQFPKQ